MLEISDEELKIIVITLGRARRDKVGGMQEYKDYVSSEIEILQKNQINASDQKSLTEMKNVFDGLINRLDMA